MSELKFCIQKSPRIPQLVADLYANMPEIEADRAELIRGSAHHQAPFRRFPPYSGEHPHHHPPGRADRRLQLPGSPGMPDLPGILLQVAGGGV